MYRELQQLDLYAKKLMRQEHYHRNFTRGLTKSSLVNPRNEENGSGITGSQEYPCFTKIIINNLINNSSVTPVKEIQSNKSNTLGLNTELD